jgi:hypothetical protein
MSALAKAIDEVKFRIPRPILDVVFNKRTERWRQSPISIDEQIMSLVVRPRVMVDFNLIGGTEAYIDLSGVPAERTGNDYSTVYRIPKDKTQGRSIMSVLNITFADPARTQSYGSYSPQNNTALLQAGSAVADAMAPIPITSTAYVQLIGENTVMVRDIVWLPSNIYLRCVLANDENMAHIPLKAYRAISKAIELAVKSYIYNEYIVPMDMGELFGGHSLGAFKTVIDGYADSEELYQTYLIEKLEKILFMSDREAWTRHLKLQMSGGH